MTFGKYYRISSNLLILTGFFAILITGSYPVAVAVGVVTTFGHWWLGDRLPTMIPIPKSAWNVIAITLLAYLFYDSFYGSRDLVGNGVRFVVYIQVVKLLSPKTDRDQMQIYLLSFLHVLASTVISNDISFSIPFLIYLVLATWTLMMFTLKIQTEASAPPEKRAAVLGTLMHSKDVITRGFLGMTSALSLSIIAFTLLVFFLFPRLSMRNFLKRIDSRQRVSGFSENVELGTIGLIKTNNTVTMRVEIDPKTLEKLDPERLYWRGTASDTFDGRRWKQSLEGRSQIHVDTDGGRLGVTRDFEAEGDRISYRVFLEALDPPLLFGADTLVQIHWDKTVLERIFRGSVNMAQDEYEGIHFAGAASFVSDLTYSADSVLRRDVPIRASRQDEEIPQSIRYYYLQLPQLDPDVLKLIRGIPFTSSDPYQRAKAIVRFLEKNYRYTLNVQDAGVADPLRFFFIEKKQGHCEYFSTALAIALRVHGIPSRQAVGYRGGEINQYGGYIAVRQSDAHTWVEAYFPSAGWIRFDPSPLDSTIRIKTRRFQALTQFTDYMRLRWNKYIIEYDLRSQSAIVEKLVRRARQQKSEGSSNQEKDRITLKDLPIPRSIWIAMAGILLMVMIWTTSRRRNEAKRDFGTFGEALRLLRKSGLKKNPAETVEEFRKRIETLGIRLHSLPKLEQLYYEERFGGRVVPPAVWERRLMEFKKDLKPLERQIRNKAA